MKYLYSFHYHNADGTTSVRRINHIDWGVWLKTFSNYRDTRGGTSLLKSKYDVCYIYDDNGNLIATKEEA